MHRAVFWTAVGLMLAGCSSASDRAGEINESPPVELAEVETTADPEILADVVAGVFMLPGAEQTRAVRMNWRVFSIANVACGGPAYDPADSTQNRYNQARLADLGLVAAKGLVEPDMSEGQRANLGACVGVDLPSFHEWYQLVGPWDEIVIEADRSAAVGTTKPEVARCLRREAGAGVEVSYEDPTGSYLRWADRSAAGASDIQAEMGRLGDAFVACTGEYFDAMERLLRPEQERMVELHRDLLMRFAIELEEAGYEPVGAP